MDLAFPIKVASETQWVWERCPCFPLGKLLPGDCNNVKTKVSPSSSLAMVVSDQKPLFGVTSHSLPHLHFFLFPLAQNSQKKAARIH